MTAIVLDGFVQAPTVSFGGSFGLCSNQFLRKSERVGGYVCVARESMEA